MTEKTKNSFGLKLFYLVFIVALIAAGFLAHNEYKADDFCREQGHDRGQYKGDGGAHYTCMDFTRYDIPE